MPLPLVPIAGLAVRYGAVALAAYAVRRSLRPGRTDQRGEDAMDTLDDGLAVHRPKDRAQTNAAARVRRKIWIGATGYELDAALIGRFRLRRL